MSCPYLDYRRNNDEHSFDHERPYCTVTENFVSPMKADLCNDRFDFHHSDHCEVYKRFVDDSEQ
ncbi:hypothetical protein ACNS7O_18240 (plasmid) [Haloferacaceae archaeon DSL9]